MRRARAVSLIELLVVLGLVSGIATALMYQLSSGFRSVASIGKRGDFETVRRSVADRLDCAQTFTANGGTCPDGANIRVYDRFGAPLNGVLETSGSFAGSGQLADRWYLRATCRAGARTLELRLALAKTANAPTEFDLDPANKGRTFDFAFSRNPIYGAAPALPICANQFPGPASPVLVRPITCGAGEVLYAIDPDGTARCRTLRRSDVPTNLLQTQFTAPTDGYHLHDLDCPAGQSLLTCNGFCVNGNMVAAHIQNNGCRTACSKNWAGGPPLIVVTQTECMPN